MTSAHTSGSNPFRARSAYARWRRRRGSCSRSSAPRRRSSSCRAAVTSGGVPSAPPPSSGSVRCRGPLGEGGLDERGLDAPALQLATQRHGPSRSGSVPGRHPCRSVSLVVEVAQIREALDDCVDEGGLVSQRGQPVPEVVDAPRPRGEQRSRRGHDDIRVGDRGASFHAGSAARCPVGWSAGHAAATPPR